jgi:serine protease AprX
MLQKNPSLTPDTIKARIMKTASKSFPLTSTATDPATGATYTDSYDIFTIGAGYLNIAGAIQDTDTVSYPALSPQVTYNGFQQSAYLVRNNSSAWWTNPSTATSAVWGTTVLIPATSAIWGSSAVWGTSTDWGTSAVWGTSGDWGTSAVWGTSNPGATSAVWGTTTGVGEK